MWAYLLGLMPTARGFFAILVAGVVGELLFGRWGGLVPVALAIASFVRPGISMWLESILFAIRFFGLAGAVFQFVLTPLATGGVQNPALGGVMLAFGVAAHLRIRALTRSGRICPAALGTTAQPRDGEMGR
ncbi:hypothetical protein C8J45_1072 [Sphingomonas sp. PP-CE-3G-477]|uniref:hypothetical protein n=1 Tax=Sphingomonas sp. PP-CE-3G-477 TaxID=2135660 RepID=UPI000D3ADFB5|nr:hypothetical protein [Sphingomonas sp. PP-CE-3G-477]PTQ63016.1 hypothetical protein C8J45_1072 [Sphingomonas sp. PP-CE-3G-477]